jgi:hypothetical protein
MRDGVGNKFSINGIKPVIQLDVIDVAIRVSLLDYAIDCKIEIKIEIEASLNDFITMTFFSGEYLVMKVVEVLKGLSGVVALLDVALVVIVVFAPLEGVSVKLGEGLHLILNVEEGFSDERRSGGFGSDSHFFVFS